VDYRYFGAYPDPVPTGCDHGRDGHLIAGDGAGLVTTDHVHTTCCTSLSISYEIHVKMDLPWKQ
jgi:hypothetical protein